MRANIRATLLAIAVSGVPACVDAPPDNDQSGESANDSSSVVSDSAPEQEGERAIEHFDSEHAAAGAAARRAVIGITTITTNSAACGRTGDTSSSVRVNDAAFSGSAKQRSGSSTSCTAPGQLEPTDDALYYCFTCTNDACDDIGSWTYNKNLRTGRSGWTRNDLLRPEPNGSFRGSSRFCGF